MKNPFAPMDVWLVPGSQHLYGPGPLRQVQQNTNAIVKGLGQARKVVVGHWEDARVQRDVASWMSVAAAGSDSRSLTLARAAWIQAGGVHHTAFSYDVTSDQLKDVAALAGVEFVDIQS